MRTKQTVRILGIESSCDETAAAVVEVERLPTTDYRLPSYDFRVRSNVVASQVQIHAQYGGVVPEVAAREHVVKVMPVIEAALRRGGFYTRPSGLATSYNRGRQGIKPCPTGIDAIAVTAGPGLMTSLAVGVETARTLAVAWGKPLVAINHIEGHVLSALLSDRNLKSLRQRRMRLWRKISPPKADPPQAENLKFPILALIVSGGHTELLLMRRWGRYRCIGATRDDAAGEAFDKVGKLLGLPYPGGPAVARAAAGGDSIAFAFPRPMMDSDDFEFSFSGLKTAVRYAIVRRAGFNTLPSGREGIKPSPTQNDIANLCASFQQAVVDTLVAKTVRAAEQYGAKTVLLGGGVAANAALREQLGAALAARLPTTDYRLPTPAHCGDNAAMIAAAGGVRLLIGQQTPWDRLQADANWEMGR